MICTIGACSQRSWIFSTASYSLWTCTGKRKQKKPQYLSQDQLSTVMNTFVSIPAEKSTSPTTSLLNPVDSTVPQGDLQPGQSPVGLPSQSNRPFLESPLRSPLHSSRPLLDPYEPLFAVEDDEDVKALEEIEGLIQLILDVTPRRDARPQGQRKRPKSDSVEVCI